MTKILVADDSEFVVSTICRVLQQSGLKAEIVAYSGDEALQKWKAERPTITLLDVHMPGLTGFEVLEQITAADPEAKVIVVTADRQDSVREIARHHGAHAVVSKNDLRDLGQVVTSILECEVA